MNINYLQIDNEFPKLRSKAFPCQSKGCLRDEFRFFITGHGEPNVSEV